MSTSDNQSGIKGHNKLNILYVQERQKCNVNQSYSFLMKSKHNNNLNQDSNQKVKLQPCSSTCCQFRSPLSRSYARIHQSFFAEFWDAKHKLPCFIFNFEFRKPDRHSGVLVIVKHHLAKKRERETDRLLSHKKVSSYYQPCIH